MRIVRYQSPGSAEVAVGLLHREHVFALAAEGASGAAPDDPVWLLGLSPAERERVASRALQGDGAPLESVTLRAPLSRPGKILALAANFSAGGRAARSPQAAPWIFAKRTDDLAGPEDAVILWPFARGVVPEIELAVVIGREGRDVAVSDALALVGAYTVGNDVSARALDLPAERRDPAFDAYMDWLNGKWLDGFAILGPALVTPDEVTDVQALEIVTRVNGKATITGNTREHVHTVAEIIAFASRLFTLHPGDVILTGTPHGPEPETFLSPGDVVEGEVTGLGVLQNPVRAPSER
jgi:2-keto-4-pentenoate hydratase/2-oxohepta-3-ene-1,7-dioic acid hydratase in catechol pathway